MKRLLLLGALVALSACGHKIDASSPDAYAKSVAKMTTDLSPADKAEFQAAMVAIAFNTADPATGIWAQADPTSPVFLAGKDKIAGKGVKEIIQLGYQTRIGLLDKQIAADVAAMQRAKEERAKYAAVFDNIHIDGARYKASRDILGNDEPEIQFHVTNGSKLPIKQIFLHGVLSSPGRSVPWISFDINYDLPGGLEPGESKALDLAPNMFGDWKPDDSFSHRSDLKLSVTLVNVAGANGEKLLHGSASDADPDAAEITKLQAERNELAQKLAKA